MGNKGKVQKISEVNLLTGWRDEGWLREPTGRGNRETNEKDERERQEYRR